MPAFIHVATCVPLGSSLRRKASRRRVIEPFCQLIREYGMSDRVLVASFHQESSSEENHQPV